MVRAMYQAGYCPIRSTGFGQMRRVGTAQYSDRRQGSLLRLCLLVFALLASHQALMFSGRCATAMGPMHEQVPPHPVSLAP